VSDLDLQHSSTIFINKIDTGRGDKFLNPIYCGTTIYRWYVNKINGISVMQSHHFFTFFVGFFLVPIPNMIPNKLCAHFKLPTESMRTS